MLAPWQVPDHYTIRGVQPVARGAALHFHANVLDCLSSRHTRGRSKLACQFSFFLGRSRM